MALDRKKFKKLKEEAENAYLEIESARDWIDGLKEKATWPKDWKNISEACTNLLEDITGLVYKEEQVKPQE